MDVRAAAGQHALEVLACGGDVGFARDHRACGEDVYGFVVDDDVEGFTWLKAGDDLHSGLADLLQLLAVHRAGTIEDECDFPFDLRPIALRLARYTGE